jgi:hypothetical protein
MQPQRHFVGAGWEQVYDTTGIFYAVLGGANAINFLHLKKAEEVSN